MKRKHLFLAIAALLVVGGLWFARTSSRTPAPQKSSTGVGSETPQMDAGVETRDGQPKSGQMLRPPNPTQRFKDFTPEQRVEFARKGSGPGG